ncbi:MAG: riboflavin biosynthesis protein RibF [Clostridiales bacterium]|nr:riboflavin biosynthesis protein RibF [Clostridiales bacterium]
MSKRQRVIALGFFDGVHLGHGALLRAVKRKAEKLGLPAAVMSFDAHPGTLVSGKAVPMINTTEDRVWLMQHYYQIDEVILAHFDEAMMHMPWRSFVTDYLIGTLGAAYVVCGRDFRFGDRGAGDARRLRDACAELGVGCEIVDMVSVDGVQVHSTVIRQLLAEGRMEEANRCLGHPHTLIQTVNPGKHLGSRLGFPTVNLTIPPEVAVPAHGVYTTKVYLDADDDATAQIAVTNVGVRPTVDSSGTVTVEGYILDFHGNLYGKRVRMEFFRHLRGERRFDSVEALTAEVLRNAEQTRQYFAAEGCVSGGQDYGR